MHRLFHSLRKFVTGNYNILLIFLGILFIIRPARDYFPIVIVWKICFTATIVLAVFNAKHSKVLRTIVTALAVPSILFTCIATYHPTHTILVLITFFTSLFLIVCSGSIIHDVILKAKVTLETLRGVICVYFLIAFFFAYLYVLLEALYPGSISIRGEVQTVMPDIDYYFSEMIYFSFITLLTIGYGDIVATKDFGQTLAVIEGIVGQFYIAILVARLVSVYSFYSDKRLLKNLQDSVAESEEQ